MSLTPIMFSGLTLFLWSFLAFFGARLNHLPSLFIVGSALTIGSLISFPKIREWKVPWKTFLVGVGGLFGYHFLYFSAFQLAPAVEVNLINYLWPLLIVLLSPILLPKFQLQPNHILGALLGLSGTALIFSAGHFELDITHLRGYLLAGAAALTWALYSLLTRRLPHFPTVAVGGFCLASGILALIIFALGFLHNPSLSTLQISRQDGLYILLVGLGPMGIAFFSWDAALKRGDPRIIGALSYLTPLFSTLILVITGAGKLTWVSTLAMLLIISGAVIGSLELFSRSLWKSKLMV